MATTTGLKPKQVTKRLLAALSERAREVVIGRYGLGKSTERQTLESIGKKYGITRERVRQIENHAIQSIRKSPVYEEERVAFAELERAINELGGVITEEELLASLAKDQSTRNHIHFLLMVGDMFQREKETEEFAHRWHTDTALAERVHQALSQLYQNLSDEDLIPEGELIHTFLEELQDVNEAYRNEEIARRWLGISKKIGRNPLGEWGRAESPNVRAKGMRDYAYLAIKRHGSPMHFREVARSITELFGRRAHEATCHNELIKDARFVLVGRGLYALSEWGYTQGVVRDVIRDIIEKNGPLSREEIIDKVRKERYVKDNTILVNLQDPSAFRRLADGTYTIAA